MREIKFRAWHRTEKYMTESLTFRNFADGYILGTGEKVDSFNFMQYTGLEDKNGKEIYEGDIIESIENGEVYTIDNMFPVHRHTHCTNIGFMDEDGFNPRSINGAHDNMDDWMSMSEFYEVIGNIYENPELTKTT